MQAGLLVDAQHHFFGAQRPGVEIADLLDRRREGIVPRDLGGEPKVMSPRLQLVVLQDPPHGVRGDAGDHPFGDQLTRHLATVPEGQGSSPIIGPLAGHLDQVQHTAGEKTVPMRVGLSPGGRRAQRRGSVRPTCARGARSGHRVGRCLSRSCLIEQQEDAAPTQQTCRGQWSRGALSRSLGSVDGVRTMVRADLRPRMAIPGIRGPGREWRNPDCNNRENRHRRSIRNPFSAVLYLVG